MRVHFALATLYFTIAAIVLVGVTCSQNISDLERLYLDKLQGYNRDLRPVLNWSSTVNIYLSLDVVTIKDFDEVNEKLSISAVMHMFWPDERMTWDPNEYGGVQSFTTSSKHFWIPTIILVNTADDLEPIRKDFFIVRVYNTSLIEYHPGAVFSSTCQMNTANYPWDTQQCAFDFVLWGFYQNEVNLNHTFDKVLQNFYTPNGIWDLIDSQATVVGGVSVHIVLKLKRKPSFIVVNVIFPIVFMSLLNLLVFLTPAECGERISYCITVLLAIAVFMTLVGDNLPKISNPMSILCFYIMGVLVISVCIIIATIISLRFYFRDENEAVTPFWIRLVTIMRCKCKRTKSNKQSKYINIKPGEDLRRQQRSSQESELYNIGNARLSTTFNPSSLYNGITVMPKLVKSGHYLRQDMTSRHVDTVPRAPTENGGKQSVITPADDKTTGESEICPDVTWKDVSGVLDYMFFVLFLLLNISCSTYCFLLMNGVIQSDETEGNPASFL